jgi:hypothetical protein
MRFAILCLGGAGLMAIAALASLKPAPSCTVVKPIGRPDPAAMPEYSRPPHRDAVHEADSRQRDRQLAWGRA